MTLSLSLYAAFGSASAGAQVGPRVAVVGWGPGASAGGLEGAVVDALRADGATVVHGDELAARVRGRREPEPSAAVLSSFAPATQRIAKGVERFFYMSPQKALPDLEPFLELAWTHPAVLAFRPDLAEQIWQAGILVVRAHAEVSGADAASLRAERLVSLFPTRELDPKVVPPETRVIFERARAAFERSAVLRLVPPDGQVCRVFLNGMAAVAGREYVVDAGGRYHAHADCGHSTAPPIWRVAVEPSARAAEVLVPPIEPQDYRTSADLDDRGRRTLEWYLEASGRAVGVDEVIGVASDGDRVRAVRLELSTARRVWADGDAAEGANGTLGALYPERGASVGSPAIAAGGAARQRPDWFGVALIGGGVAAGATGTYLLVAASRQGRLLDCAVNNPAPPSSADCSDVPDDIYFPEFSRETRRVGTARAVGIVLVGSGIAAAGYGILRLVAPRLAGRRVGSIELTGDGFRVVW